MKEIIHALSAFDRGEIDRDKLLSLAAWREAPSAKARIAEITSKRS